MLPISKDAIFVEGDPLVGEFPPTFFHVISVVADGTVSNMTVSFVELIQPRLRHRWRYAYYLGCYFHFPSILLKTVLAFSLLPRTLLG